MKTSIISTRVSLTSLLALGAALPACTDPDVRELGNTVDYVTAAQPDDSGEFIEPRCEPLFIDQDSQQRLAAEDLRATPEEDRPFLRYVSLADRHDAGACGADITISVNAFAKLINGLSREPEIVAPVAVGEGPTLLRFDLRDYGWTREVEVAGEAFANGWEAVIAASPFAIELTGPDASFLAAETGTRVPVLSSSAFVRAAADSALYYPLLGIPATLGELRESVGLPAELDPLENGAERTGVRYSRVLRPGGNVRVLDRYAIASGTQGSYYEAAQIDAAELLADPLHVQPAVQRLIMFTLPNDLNAFALMNAAGEQAGSGDLVLDTNRDDFTARVSASCSNCHAQGAIPGVDDVRGLVLERPELFDAEVVKAYVASPTDDERFARIAREGELYSQALQKLGFDGSGGDPISASSLTFELAVELPVAAGTLLVPEAVIDARADELPELLPLVLDFNLSPEKFGAVYAASYCVLHAEDENPPSAEACAVAP